MSRTWLSLYIKFKLQNNFLTLHLETLILNQDRSQYIPQLPKARFEWGDEYFLAELRHKQLRLRVLGEANLLLSQKVDPIFYLACSEQVQCVDDQGTWLTREEFLLESHEGTR